MLRSLERGRHFSKQKMLSPPFQTDFSDDLLAKNWMPAVICHANAVTFSYSTPIQQKLRERNKSKGLERLYFTPFQEVSSLYFFLSRKIGSESSGTLHRDHRHQPLPCLPSTSPLLYRKHWCGLRAHASKGGIQWAWAGVVQAGVVRHETLPLSSKTEHPRLVI